MKFLEKRLDTTEKAVLVFVAVSVVFYGFVGLMGGIFINPSVATSPTTEYPPLFLVAALLMTLLACSSFIYYHNKYQVYLRYSSVYTDHFINNEGRAFYILPVLPLVMFFTIGANIVLTILSEMGVWL